MINLLAGFGWFRKDSGWFRVVLDSYVLLFVTFQAKTSTQTFLPGKRPEVHRDSPGFNGKFTGIHWEVHWDVPESFLGYGFLFSEFTGKSREVSVSLPRKLEIYWDITMSSPVFHRCMTGEFSISWEIFVLVFAWNVTF